MRNYIQFAPTIVKTQKYSKCPTPLPILGNVLSVLSVDAAEEVFLKWRKKYGNVYTYWQADIPMVVLADFNTIQETLQKDGDSYTGRMILQPFHQYVTGGVYGIIHNEGDIWREHRRFALHVLRDFGLGKNLMQERILDEVTQIINCLKDRIDHVNKDAEYDIVEHIDIAIGSIINSILFGYRFHGEKLSEYHTLTTLLRNMFNAFTNPLALLGLKYPKFCSKVPFFGSAISEIKHCSDELYKFFNGQIEEHRKSIDFETDSTPTDFVEAYLREAHKKDKEGVEHSFSIKQLANTCSDLWGAGQETTNFTLAWAFAYMISYPEVQEKLQQELDRVVGSTDRLVTITDRQNLHYANAVVAEVQRIANLLPQNVPHKTTRAVNIGGMKIDKDVVVLPQISCVLFDEKLFPKPLEFNPGRFIDENGCFKKCEELIPFSMGKRQCLGEPLARMELFLFITNLVNHFTFLPGTNTPNLARRRGILVKPDKFECKIEVKQK
ncbi:cytochrome p450 domain-containing protein [Ditylenchus destructor]|uniref:Cytochrome p450 domain-containing protein n=1 Tax=Ditylenchus destructor TaxID=166010 RepID=A0AAD4MWF1_9BILA|nr:cytochrome p450 domain-containing protein [Ditylenchus destructor]